MEDVIRSGCIAQGSQVESLEKGFVSLYGGGGGCACSSGTAALFLALKGLGMGQGDFVAVPTYACSALLNAVLLAGSEPLVVDVREDDFTIDPNALAVQASEAKAVIAVHAFGAKADVAALRECVPLLIEDCCQSLGGMRGNGPVGSEGDAAVFSFYATKIITCGHGGLVWDVEDKVASWARDFRDFDRQTTYKARFNFHLTDFQAAMARSQLARLEEIAAKRHEIARKYLEALPDGLSVQKGVSDPGRMVYRFVLKFPEGKTRDEAQASFAEGGVKAIVPVERYELLHRYLKLNPADYPIAERLADTTLSIPMYPALSDEDVVQICKILSEIAVR